MAHSKAHRKAISDGLKRYHAGKSKKKWIKNAIKHPGALTRKAKRMGLLKGDEKLTKVDLNVLEHVRNPTTRKQAYLAATLKNLPRHTGPRKRVR